jgi:hypothetical protein
MTATFLLLGGIAGLDVGLVDEAVVEEKVVEARSLGVQGRVGVDGTGVVAGSQELYLFCKEFGENGRLASGHSDNNCCGLQRSLANRASNRQLLVCLLS